MLSALVTSLKINRFKRCIDRFFDTPASDWDVLAAERGFALELGDYSVSGIIDAVARRENGDLVVLDYKATQTERSLDENLQLPLYLIAINEMLEEDVSHAGYVYVGETGPKVELRSFSHDELGDLRTMLVDHVREIEESTYGDYTPGEHCEWCPHRSLPCSDKT